MSEDFMIDPEIEALLPPRTPEEFEKLRAKILESEHVDDLVVLKYGDVRILGDGHGRLKICQGEGIPYTTREVEVKDRDAALQWVIDNQLARRNLTEEQKAYYRGKEYLLEKQQVGGDRVSEEANRHSDGMVSTAERIAEKHKVAPRTVERDAKFAEAVDKLPEPAKANVLAGKSGQTKKEMAAGVF